MSSVPHNCSPSACTMHIKVIKTHPESRELAEVDSKADWWTNKKNMRGAERQGEYDKGEQIFYSYWL